MSVTEALDSLPDAQELKNKTSSIVKRVAHLSSDICRLKLEEKHLNKGLDNARDTSHLQNRRYEAANAKLKDLKKRRAECKEKTAAALKKVPATVNVVRNLAAQKENIEQNAAKNQHYFTQQKSDSENTEKRIKSAIERVAVIRKKLSSNNDRYKQVSQSKAQLEKFRKNGAAKIEFCRRQWNEFNGSLDQIRRKREALKNKIDFARSTLSETKKLTAELEAKRTEFSSLITEYQQIIDDNHEMEQLQKTLAEIDEKRRDAREQIQNIENSMPVDMAERRSDRLTAEKRLADAEQLLLDMDVKQVAFEKENALKIELLKIAQAERRSAVEELEKETEAEKDRQEFLLQEKEKKTDDIQKVQDYKIQELKKQLDELIEEKSELELFEREFNEEQAGYNFEPPEEPKRKTDTPPKSFGIFTPSEPESSGFLTPSNSKNKSAVFASPDSLLNRTKAQMTPGPVSNSRSVPKRVTFKETPIMCGPETPPSAKTPKPAALLCPKTPGRNKLGAKFFNVAVAESAGKRVSPRSAAGKKTANQLKKEPLTSDDILGLFD